MRRRAGLALIAGAVLALGLPGASARPGAQGLLGAFRWRGTGAAFGGFSALHVFPRGEMFLAITDRAHWVQ
ncbi:MAG TPA: esterase-like activity of phytase family protein, partial [Paracoccaceae bacterium]|nr:esterase-like activity of phytase family protein [Paracoccaceae bacterium]